MPAVEVRDVPSEVLDALERRAAAHHRSLEGELLLILSEAASEAPPAVALPPLRLHMAKEATQGTWRREDIYDDDGR